MGCVQTHLPSDACLGLRGALKSSLHLDKKEQLAALQHFHFILPSYPSGFTAGKTSSDSTELRCLLAFISMSAPQSDLFQILCASGGPL